MSWNMSLNMNWKSKMSWPNEWRSAFTNGLTNRHSAFTNGLTNRHTCRCGHICGE